MECYNLEQVMNAFEKHELGDKDYYYSKIFKIFKPDFRTFQFIVDKCKRDKTIIYTKNYHLGEKYLITKLVRNNYNEYKNRKQQYNFTHYEENVLNSSNNVLNSQNNFLNSSNNNLITPKISSPRYFESQNTLLEKRKIDNDDIEGSKKLKIITDVNETVSEKVEPINISFKNGKIITNEKIKEIYNLETDENEIYINDLLIGNINDSNLQLSDEIVKKYTKLEFTVDV
jgi:hypothetical protein